MASGVWRAGTPAAVVLARAAGAVVAAVLAAQGASTAAQAANTVPPAVESTREITLDALGVPTQTLYGRFNTVSAFFPAPPGQLAATGSVLRLLFAHSPLLDGATSTVEALINGQRLATIPLDPATADGAAAELKIPGSVLHDDRSNLLEVRFDARLAGRTTGSTDDPSAFVRLEGQTLLRYQLAASATRLDSYPFPLVGTHGTGPARVGLVLPQPPTPADLAAGLRLVADLGRRAGGQQVAPEVVTGDQMDWLHAGGLPALVLGGRRRLPAAEPLLRAAGFTLGPGGWITPDGHNVGQDAGVVASLVSPWDRHSAIVVVTGDSDGALARAADALTAPASLPHGTSFAVIPATGAPPSSSGAPRPGDTLSFPELDDQALQVQGPGRHALSLVFTAPAAAAGSTGELDLGAGHSPVPAGHSATLDALVDGTSLGTVTLNARNEQESAVVLPIPGSTLHPGRNTLTLAFTLAGDGASALIGSDVRLRLPGSPDAATGLELLPYPIFDDPSGLQLVLGAPDDSILTGAARVVAALGERAAATPAFSAGYASDTRSGTSLLVLGLPAASAGAARVADRAGLSATPVPVMQSAGSVRELDAGPHHVLWVDGGAASLALVGDALAHGALTGPGATVDGSGAVRELAPAAPPATEPPAVTKVKVLIAVAAGLLVLGVVWPSRRREATR